MTFNARLNLKFYIVTALLFCAVLFVWYGIYFLNANEILMEDNTPMDSTTKLIFTVLMSLIAISWTLSLFTLTFQIIVGVAFCLNEEGIHTTATAAMVLAFIFVIPVKTIPYDAIREVCEKSGILCLRLDKSKITVLPIFRPLLRNEYNLFCGFTKESPSQIKQIFEQFIEKHKKA